MCEIFYPYIFLGILLSIFVLFVMNSFNLAKTVRYKIYSHCGQILSQKWHANWYVPVCQYAYEVKK